MRQKTNIFLLGTTHISNKSKKDIEKLNRKIKFDCFLSEGTTDYKEAYTLENFIKESFFLISVYLYFKFLEFFGKDMSTLQEISKEKNIPLYSIDKSLSEILEDGHRWYNNLVFWLIFLIILISFIFGSILRKFPFYLTLILSFLGSLIIYLGYFVVIRANRNREFTFINKIKSILENQKYKNVLLVCGKYHKEIVRKSLIKESFEVIDAKILLKKR